MSDARRYAVWPDPRSRSRSLTREVDRQSPTGLIFQLGFSGDYCRLVRVPFWGFLLTSPLRATPGRGHSSRSRLQTWQQTGVETPTRTTLPSVDVADWRRQWVTTPGGSRITASLGGRYDPSPVKRSSELRSGCPSRRPTNSVKALHGSSVITEI